MPHNGLAASTLGCAAVPRLIHSQTLDMRFSGPAATVWFAQRQVPPINT
jgi:hypothetical protein